MNLDWLKRNSGWRNLVIVVTVWIFTAMLVYLGRACISDPDLRNYVIFLLGLLAAGGIGWTGSYVSGGFRVQNENRELLAALYVEFLSQAWRACHDYKSPWRYFDFELSPDNGGVMFPARIQKFKPDPLVVFPSSSHSLGKLNANLLGLLIHFYGELSHWSRDLDFGEKAGANYLKTSGSTQAIGRRLRMALRPALEVRLAFEAALGTAGEIDVRFSEQLRADYRPASTIKSELMDMNNWISEQEQEVESP